MSEPIIYVYTDGSCGTGDEALGTWCSVLMTGQNRKVLVGTAMPTTISRMELTPIIEALLYIRKSWTPHARGINVQCWSDSEYTIKTLCGVYAGKKNLDLWEGVKIAAQGFKMSYHWAERCKLEPMSFCDNVCTSLREGSMELLNMITGDWHNLETGVTDMQIPQVERV